MKNIFFREKGKRILLALANSEKQCLSELTNNIKSTYAHTFNLVKEMEDLGIVSTAKEGRTKYVVLTEKGRKLAGLTQDFLTVLGSKRKKTSKKVRITPTSKKLSEYESSLTSILKKMKSRKLDSKQLAKYARIAGRYKALNSKLRPRDKLGKELKAEVNLLLKEIDLILKAHKV